MFASKYINEAETYWEDVIFIDESKFNLIGRNDKQNVRRKPNTKLKKTFFT